jgi:hypothetical protein
LDAIGYTEPVPGTEGETEVLPGLGDDESYTGGEEIDTGTLTGLGDDEGYTEPEILPGLGDDEGYTDTLDYDSFDDDMLRQIADVTPPDYDSFDEDMLRQIEDPIPYEDIPEMVVTDKKEPPDYDSFDDDMLRQIEDPIPYKEEEEDKKSVTPKLPVTSKPPVKPKTPATDKKSTTDKTPAVNTDALKTLLASLLANQQQQYLPGIGDVARIISDESLFGAILGTSPERETQQETQYDPVAELLAQGDEEYARGGHVDEFSVEALLQILRS